MDYYGQPSFLQSHTGNGGMTTSLAQGISGSAKERRLAMFPLSPMYVSGRSALTAVATLPLFDPRDGVVTTAAQLEQLKNQQWTNRTKPVYSREEIDMMLGSVNPRLPL